jgi:16S rRNA processing protein RimM
MEEPMVVLGRIAGPHGIRGQLKIIPFTEYIDSLLDYPVWWLSKDEKSWRKVHPSSVSVHDDRLIITLPECNDRTSASELKGWKIAVPRSKLPELPDNGEDGYYWSDLIGTSVFNTQGEALGNVIGLIETGANDVLQVRFSENDKERLIPFIEQIIVEVNLESRRITVDWGLDY